MSKEVSRLKRGVLNASTDSTSLLSFSVLQSSRGFKFTLDSFIKHLV